MCEEVIGSKQKLWASSIDTDYAQQALGLVFALSIQANMVFTL